MKYSNFILPLNRKLTALLAVFFLAVTIISCDSDDEDPIPEPIADFSVVISGKSITTTNTSTDGETYSWDFGDEGTSTEEAPTHTYAANGSYLVKLTVTNASGEDSKSEVLEIVNISIDGDLSEWDDVAAVNHSASGSFKSIKIDNLGKEKLFVYVEMTDEGTSFFDFYANLDYDITGEADTTGYLAGGYSANFGADLLFEGFFANTAGRTEFGMFYGIFNDDALVDFGAREEPVLDAQMLVTTDFVDITGGKAFEFSIDLSFLPAGEPVSDNIQIFIDEWDHDANDTSGWWAAFSGKFPEPNVTDATGAITSTPITYTFK